MHGNLSCSRQSQICSEGTFICIEEERTGCKRLHVARALMHTMRHDLIDNGMKIAINDTVHDPLFNWSSMNPHLNVVSGQSVEETTEGKQKW